MSASRPKVYRFLTAKQWKSCLLHRLDVQKDGSLMSARRLAKRATLVRAGQASVVAIDPHGIAFWRDADAAGVPILLRIDDLGAIAGPFEIEGALASGTRWAIDRDWIWSAAPASTAVHRYERDSLQHDLTLHSELPILDVAADGRQGVWLLLRDGDDKRILLHIDCEGHHLARYPVPAEAGAPNQLGSVNRGTTLVLLSRDGKRLVFVSAAQGAIERTLNVGDLAPCWSARKLATDTRARIALWGPQAIQGRPKESLLFVFDGAGDTVDGPLKGSELFTSSPGPAVAALAVHRDGVWFATDVGVWRLGAGTQRDERESDSTLLTQALFSPDSDSTRGWLRAEVSIDLPRGAVLDAEYATTDDERLASQAIRAAEDPSTTTEQKQDTIWQLFDEHPASRQFRFTATPQGSGSIAIPLFESSDRWLWLRLKVMTPPGTAPGPLKELRVLYPELSIARYLPAAFRGARKDPTGSMRRLVGVLESTTQGLDERIRRIATYLGPETAPVAWLDYLARWLDLPWDDELPKEAKQAILTHAGELLDQRGTRAGLTLLLQCLAGDRAAIRIADVTVDYATPILGGGTRQGFALPALLAGASLRAPILGAKAVLGRARLCRDADPLRTLSPRLRIELVASRDVQRTLEHLLPRLLAQYIPAAIATEIRWIQSPAFGSAMSDGDDVELDGNGPGRLGRDSAIGRTVVAGRRGRLNDAGLRIGFTLR